MTEKKTRKNPSKKSGRGGRREGAGRKLGTKMVENPHNKMLPFRVTEDTYRRVKGLRELTKQDAMPFVAMFEKWVEEMAGDYGIE